MSNDVKEKVTGFIVNNFLFGQKGNLQDSTSLLDAGIVDSQGILELVFFLEELGIGVEDDELIPDNLDSINKIVSFVNKKAVMA